MRVAEFDYTLPEELIAQEPLAERDASRLLVLRSAGQALEHRAFRELPELLEPGDLLVVNDARVIPARLLGRKRATGGSVEVLLVEPTRGVESYKGAPVPHPSGSIPQTSDIDIFNIWRCMAQAAKPIREGALLDLDGGLEARVLRDEGGGFFQLQLSGDLRAALESKGQTPLPPYIHRPLRPEDRERYQTVFARVPGAVAAPTAGLHFTARVLDALAARGIALARVTLHVGPGTFLPVRTERVEDHRMHRERYDVPPETTAACANARRIVAVGTTALRTLEASWDDAARAPRPGPGDTDLFVCPGYRFRAARALLTNFHLPRSTLLMLVCAFGGTDRVLAAYREAVRERYRFFSYGDAMLLL